MGTRTDSRVARSLARAEKSNVLIGAALHAADRLRQGKTATDLEQMALSVMRAALSDQEIRDWGRVYRESVDELGSLAVVPEVITSRPGTNGFSFDDLKADFAPVAAEHMARPNTMLVDREAVAAGRSIDTPEFIAGMREWGFGVTVFDGPPAAAEQAAQGAGESDGQEPAASSFDVKLLLESFYVQRAVGDQGGGRDEIYWCSSSASDQQAGPAFMSEEFGAVKKGDTRHFSTSNRTVFDGKSSKGVLLNILCWEADQSSSAWYDDLRKALNDLSRTIFNKWHWQLATGILPGTDIAGYMGELVGFGVFLMDHLRNKDDLSCERAIYVDQYDLAMLSYRETIDWNFDGDGHHILKARYSGDPAPFPTGTLEYAVHDGLRWGTPISLRWESMAAPSLVSYKGALHVVYVRPGDKAVMWARRENGRWTRPVRLNGWVSNLPLGLSVFRDKLYCTVIHTTDETPHWASYDGTRWTSIAQLRGGGPTRRTAALGANSDRMMMSVVDHQSGNVRDFPDTGSGWGNALAFPQQSPSPATMARVGNTLYKAIRTANNKVSLTRWSDNTPAGPVWTRMDNTPEWGITCGPTLAEHVGWLTATTPWIFLRATDGTLQASHYKPVTFEWHPAHHVGSGGSTNPIKPMDEVAAARHDGKLYVMYRR
ncbi:hypothetical protein [Streptomyces lydicus]|uniref:hypothetical protein n=1 Tax=Streptomyces lydicus TaxID=47763 RepID=UPI0037B3E976